MSDNELKQQEQKQDNKEKRKQTFKVAFISSVCTLLLIIIILFCVILGLKKCTRVPSNNGSSSSGDSSGPVYNFDNDKLDTVFKKIVSKQMLVDGFDPDELTEVLGVTYTDNSTSFDLDISVRSISNVYYYHLDNSIYTGYDNFVSYILEFDFDNKVGRPLDGDEVSINYLSISNDSINTDKECKYVITTNDLGTTKYLSGYYIDNHEYHVYLKKELIDNNPFDETADKIIIISDYLYGYYQSINLLI